MPHIRGRSPLCSTWDIDRHFSFRKLNSQWNIKVVQNLKSLKYGLTGIILHRSCSLIKGSPHKTGGRSHITGNTQESASSPERTKSHIPSRLRLGTARIQIDVIIQVGQLPFKSRRVSQYSQVVFKEMQFTVYDFQYHLTS